MHLYSKTFLLGGFGLRRDILGLEGRKGRHPVLDEQQDIELWHQWKTLTDERRMDMTDESAMLNAAMDLAEHMALPLAVVWAAIKSWQSPETEKDREYTPTKQASNTERVA